MPRRPDEKLKRYKALTDYMKSNPFATDKELAIKYNVSVNTIRLDRSVLNIKEVRERIKEEADNNYSKIKSLKSDEIIGNIVQIVPGERAKAIFTTKTHMTFDKNEIIRGHYLYSFAETLAIAVIPEDSAIVGVANIKYKKPVFANEDLEASATVKKERLKSYIVHIIVKNISEEVFRAKFILKSI